MIFTAPSQMFSIFKIPLIHRYPRDRRLELVDGTADVCCPTCSSLGYLYTRDHDETHRRSLIVVSNRSFDDFRTSAVQGCFFCDLVLQSFLLLQYVTAEMRVELLLYPDSPAELHSSDEQGFHEIVEIYPCSSKCLSSGRTSMKARR